MLVFRYERVDELIWVKTNQLQRIIRTGRTGHWFNHGKEHCLVSSTLSVLGPFRCTSKIEVRGTRSATNVLRRSRVSSDVVQSASISYYFQLAAAMLPFLSPAKNTRAHAPVYTQSD